MCNNDRRGKAAGRRLDDKVVSIVTNPCYKEVIDATYGLYIDSIRVPRTGIGFFLINDALQWEYALAGTANTYPELACGIMTKIIVDLSTNKR